MWPSRQGGERPTRGPLHGLRVVDMATFLAGPYAPALFAYWGADVVKIEVGEGDPYRAYGISYLAVNQAKQSLSFDLATTADRDELERVIGGADVFIDNFRPSTREALGLDDDAIERINPRLIHGRLTAFGDDGAWAERPGFDPSIQALSGLMVATGGPATPLNTTTPVHDVGAGVSMALGVLAALWHRHSSGIASTVAGSLAGASSLLQCAEFTDFDRRPPAGVGKVDFIGPSVGRRFYRAVDGWVAIAARDAGELERALAALGASADRIDDDPDGSAARSLAASIIGRPVADVVDDLRACGHRGRFRRRSRPEPRRLPERQSPDPRGGRSHLRQMPCDARTWRLEPVGDDDPRRDVGDRGGRGPLRRRRLGGRGERVNNLRPGCADCSRVRRRRPGCGPQTIRRSLAHAVS